MVFPRRFGLGAGFPGFEKKAYEEFLELPNAPYQRVEDHCASAKELLLEQFKGKQRIETLLCAFMGPVQRLEDTLWQVLTRVVDLDHAEGVHLDAPHGKILALPRAGLSDDEYRSRLRVWQLVLRSNGRAEELIRIAVRFDNVDAVEGDRVVLDEGTTTGAVVLTMEHLMQHSPTTLFLFLRKAKAGGVEFQLIWEPDGPDATFRWSSLYDDEEASAAGMGYDDEADAGGTLADVRA